MAPRDVDHGLSSAAVARRRARDGPNELPASKPKGFWAIARDVVLEPMFVLLIAASAIYLLLGEPRDALVLLASVVVVVGITLFQGRKAERALDALRELSCPRTQVLRDGTWRHVAGRELVVDDVIAVKEGDRVPADGVLLSDGHLVADESLLTGESVPVRKRVGGDAREPARPGGDDTPYVYSGTLITQGQGVARITATGASTAVGRIGKALYVIGTEATPLQREVRRAVVVFAALGLALCLLVTVAYGWSRGDWLAGVLAGLTLAMANLPEEFPVVLTIFLALGAWRMSRKHVLARHMPAIETLGSTTVLCVDKTGTLTQNRMAVEETWTPDARAASADLVRARTEELLAFGVLASDRQPFDPMEKALLVSAAERAPRALASLDGWRLERVYPFTPEARATARIWRTTRGAPLVIAAKGAPEAILARCRLDEAQRAEVLARVADLGAAALRVLAVARGTIERRDDAADGWPASLSELPLELLGLIGLADPVRASVPPALRECYRAGIRTVMITGDYPGTARSIARQVGLARPDSVVTGAELERLSDAELRTLVARSDVYARIAPEQKLRLVEAFKANGEIVAMTGDGVNDAPALKAAHIGVAMGKRGSDVAREAASLVLLEDDFASMVEAVRLGRRIYANIRKATSYIVAVHVPTAGMALLPLLLGWPLFFYPVHIVFLEFVIDPACTFAFEAEPPEADAMERPPRSSRSHLFDGRMLADSLFQGTSVLVAVAVQYGWALAVDVPEAQARAMAFASLVLLNIGLILTNRSRSHALGAAMRTPNRALVGVVAGALAGLAIALGLEPVRDVFRFGALSVAQVGWSLGTAVAGMAWLALYRRGRRGGARA
jgi:Ca2+-transporting ATPase